MADVGGQPGNVNATRGKLFRGALRRVFERDYGSMDAGLERVAKVLIYAAIEQKEPWAIKEIADRVDGKPAQAIIGGDEDEAPVTFKGVVELVRPT